MTSSVLKWPDAATVLAAADQWARDQAARRPGLLALGIFGSYARGDAGVGSDLDFVAVIESSPQPFQRRAATWDLTPLPVPAEILVYTRDEWARLRESGSRFARTLSCEAVWLVGWAEAAGFEK